MCYLLTAAEIASIVARHPNPTDAIREALALAGLRPDQRKIPPPPPAPRLGTWAPGTIVVEAPPTNGTHRAYAGAHTPAAEDDGA